MRLYALLFVVIVVACSEPAPTGPVHSGSRLKLARYGFEDGTEKVETRWFYDTVLESRCTPMRADPLHTRCVPDADDVVFADACRRPLARIPHGGARHRYAVATRLTYGQLSAAKLFETGSPTETPSEFWRVVDNACVGPFPPGDADYYTVGEELREDTMVVMRVNSSGENPRLFDRGWVSDDGLRTPSELAGYLDGSFVECRLDAPDAPVATCEPSMRPVSHFADAECTEPLIESGDGFAFIPDESSGCKSYVQLTDDYEPIASFVRSRGRCTTDRLEETPRWRRSMPAALPTIARTPAGDGRLQPIQLGDLAYVDELLHDTELGVDCRLDDRDLRCIPAALAETRTLSSDAGCQSRLDVALVATRECDTHASFADLAGAIVPVGEPVANTLYVAAGDLCIAYAPPAGIVPHAVGPVIPREQFPLATLVIDP